MTSIITSWIGGVESVDYSLVDPPTPQADVYFKQQQSRLYNESRSSSLWPPVKKLGHERQTSRSSYSNEDFDEEGKMKESCAFSDNSDWNETVHTISLWTSNAANMVTNAIITTTNQVTDSPDSLSTLEEEQKGYNVGSEMRLRKASTSIKQEDPKVYGKKIDRSYLKDSLDHVNHNQRSFGAYVADLANRFTAPKVDSGKERWID